MNFLKDYLIKNSAEISPNLARFKTILGRLYANHSDYQMQKETLQSAYDMYCKLYGEKHYESAKAQAYLAAAYGSLGENEKQLSLLINSLEIIKGKYPADSIEVAKIQKRLANAYAKLYQPDKQATILKEILPIFIKHYGEDYYHVGHIYLCLGYAYGSMLDSGDRLQLLNLKKEYMEKALDINTKYYGAKAIITAHTLLALADTNGDLGNHDQMFSQCEIATNNIKTTIGISNEPYASALIYLAKAYGYKGDNANQRKCLTEIFDIIEDIKGSEQTYLFAMHLLDQIDDPNDQEIKLHKLKRLLEFRKIKYGEQHQKCQTLLEKINDIETNYPTKQYKRIKN